MAWGSSFDRPTDRIDNYKLTGPVPLDGLKLHPKKGWIDPFAAADAKLLNDVLMQDGSIYPAEFDTPALGYAFKALTKEEVLAKWPMSERNNKVPTHDPYTNPNAIIYYECKCGQILDPGTKRFAELNNCASNAGWKIRFSDSGYVPYCVECGKGVE